MHRLWLCVLHVSMVAVGGNGVYWLKRVVCRFLGALLYYLFWILVLLCVGCSVVYSISGVCH